MKPLLVGDSPSRSNDSYWQTPLSGYTAQVLCQAAGFAPMEEQTRYGRWTKALYARFDCVNVYQRYPTGGWSLEFAADRMKGILEINHEVVVLLGESTRKAYLDAIAPADSPVADVDLYQWVHDPSPLARRDVVVLPRARYLTSVYDLVARRKVGEVLNAAVEKSEQVQGTSMGS